MVISECPICETDSRERNKPEQGRMVRTMVKKKNHVDREHVEEIVKLQMDTRKMKSPLSNSETWDVLNGKLPVSLTDDRIEVLADLMQRIRRMQRERKSVRAKRGVEEIPGRR